MRVCPNCRKEDELYRIVGNVVVTEDIFIEFVDNEKETVEYYISDTDIDDSLNGPYTYRCSYCQHLYNGEDVESIYFNEMIEKEKR